jgi:hypothetical protein
MPAVTPITQPTISLDTLEHFRASFIEQTVSPQPMHMLNHSIVIIISIIIIIIIIIIFSMPEPQNTGLMH